MTALTGLAVLLAGAGVMGLTWPPGRHTAPDAPGVQTPEPNRHVREFLDDYVSGAAPPGYAVLLNGPWGAGKTYFVKDVLRSLSEGPRRGLYVSLYGLDSLDEIDEALFRASLPPALEKTASIGGRLLKVASRNVPLKGLEDLLGVRDLKEFLTRRVDVLVFDDLERCSLPIEKVLGVINDFVEHRGLRVILVANEREIRDQEAYVRIREKVIGKTFGICPPFREAFQVFVASLENEDIRTFLFAREEEIHTLFRQSKLGNLRILQQTLWDFARFYRVLDDRHRASDRAMSVVLRLLLALSFEVRAGRLKEEDLKDWSRAMADRHARAVSGRRKDPEHSEPPLPLVLSLELYPGVDILDKILSDAVLVDFLFRSRLDKDQIHADLNASYFFTRPLKSRAG